MCLVDLLRFAQKITSLISEPMHLLCVFNTLMHPA